jgi:DNA-directed RNA polymerase subunit M/transcription elongation factor TFIIS
MNSNRFADQHFCLSDLQNEVWVHCTQCQKMAITKVYEKQARLICTHCGYHKVVSTIITNANGKNAELKQAAHAYFGAELWLSASFKNDIVCAYNLAHLEYIEQYISAKLREHKDREHFTLLEKLPKFYHESKNRTGLLKLIEKLIEK